MPQNFAIAIFATIMATLAMPGCNVGPDYRRPPTTMPCKWGELPSSQAATQPALLEGWWKNFHDPVLNDLIHQAISNNPSLRLAQARVVQARAECGIVAANDWPSVFANGSYQRFGLSRNASSGTGGTGAAGTRTPSGSTQPSSQPFTSGFSGQNLWQFGFDASWEIDVFGKTRRGVEAANDNTAAALEDRRDVLVSLLAEVAVNYMSLRSAQKQLAITYDTLHAQEKTLELTQRRLKAGTSSGLDVAQAQAQLSATKAQIPPLQTTVHTAIHQLSILIGRQPMSLMALAEQTAPIPTTPPEVPVGFPSDVLLQRPDIRRAERQLAAATAQIGVATADLYPQFFIAANAGYQSTRLESLVNGKSFFWNAGPSINWTIFDGGAIRSNILAKTAQEQQAMAVYEQAILTALKDVEDALVSYFQEQAHRTALQETVKADEQALELANVQFLYGRSDFLNVLDAQRTLYMAQTALARSDEALATDLVSLYKALGGGWHTLN